MKKLILILAGLLLLAGCGQKDLPAATAPAEESSTTGNL